MSRCGKLTCGRPLRPRTPAAEPSIGGRARGANPACTLEIRSQRRGGAAAGDGPRRVIATPRPRPKTATVFANLSRCWRGRVGKGLGAQASAASRASWRVATVPSAAPGQRAVNNQMSALGIRAVRPDSDGTRAGDPSPCPPCRLRKPRPARSVQAWRASQFSPSMSSGRGLSDDPARRPLARTVEARRHQGPHARMRRGQRPERRAVDDGGDDGVHHGLDIRRRLAARTAQLNAHAHLRHRSAGQSAPALQFERRVAKSRTLA